VFEVREKLPQGLIKYDDNSRSRASFRTGSKIGLYYSGNIDHLSLIFLGFSGFYQDAENAYTK
jgi:hypothetical protein